MRSLNVDLTRKELRKLALLQLAGDAAIIESTHGKINRRLEQSILISPLCNVAMTVTLNSDSYFTPGAAIRDDDNRDAIDGRGISRALRDAGSIRTESESA